jgi:hypothetical protein
MPHIKLDKEYPLRFDMLCLKKFKDKTSKDLLKGVSDLQMEDVIYLVRFAVESGCRFDKVEFTLSDEDIAMYLKPGDLSHIYNSFYLDLGIKETPSEGTGE